MLIVTKEEFIKMPAGTIFAPWVPCCFDAGFEIKVDAGDGEHYNGTMPLEPWIDCIMPLDPGQYDVDFEIYDGDQNDIYKYKYIAVLEPKDIVNLISKLVWALNGCPDTDSSTIFTPDEFAGAMEEARRSYGHDTEMVHRCQDGIMCELLRGHGYGKGIDIFDSTNKWYA